LEIEWWRIKIKDKVEVEVKDQVIGTGELHRGGRYRKKGTRMKKTGL